MARHASHAVNDFRKLCGFEAYTPTDNDSELTARTNDEGRNTTYSAWLEGSRCRAEDGLLVFSVGGGDAEAGISANLVAAIDLARAAGASLFGTVGGDGGYTARCAEACAVIPPLVAERITPHTEGLCAVVWHLLVSHPALQRRSDEMGAACDSMRGLRSDGRSEYRMKKRLAIGLALVACLAAGSAAIAIRQAEGQERRSIFEPHPQLQRDHHDLRALRTVRTLQSIGVLG